MAIIGMKNRNAHVFTFDSYGLNLESRKPEKEEEDFFA
jgi:hypothetical protein